MPFRKRKGYYIHCLLSYFAALVQRSFVILITCFFLFRLGAYGQITENSPQTFVVKQIYILGNKKTKEALILRELSFKQGDTLNTPDLPRIWEQSKRQVINTRLFNEVEIVNDSTGNVFIGVKEDWYIYPIPVLEVADRNFNQWWLSKDLARLDYGIRFYWFNFTGQNDKLKIVLQSGYTQQMQAEYTLPFIDRKKHWGIGINAFHSANREVWAYPQKDKISFFSDNNRFLIWRTALGLSTTYRKGIFDKHSLELNLIKTNVADTVVSETVNPLYLSAGKTRQTHLQAAYTFIYDKRDIRGYPLRGYFLKSILDTDLYNPSTSHRDYNIRLTGMANIYQPLSERIYANAGISAATSRLEQPPYMNFHALGYENRFVRGYEYYVVDGKDFALFRSNIKYAIVKEKKYYAGILPPAFRTIAFTCLAGFFYDAGYVNSPFTYVNNRLPNTWLSGYGVGVDMVFFYDRVARIEYTFNGLNERGVFLHFYAPL